ncbi:MAG: hypothetical protein HY238_13170, partial [Acidobacteria bacterium]|nr:hypothetical protein [Acidobacteriota bacterium]
EDVKSFAASGGTITDPARLEAIRAFLAKHQSPLPVVEKDEVNQQTNVRGKGDIVVRLMKLEHR